MFSSNQVIQISCDRKQLEDVIGFFFKMYEFKPHIIYQPLINGRIAIGYYYGDDESSIPEGWKPFVVDNPSLALIAATISDWVRHVYNYNDGFILRTPECMDYEDLKEIRNWNHTIFIVQDFNLFYHK